MAEKRTRATSPDVVREVLVFKNDESYGLRDMGLYGSGLQKDPTAPYAIQGR
jgi:hypothetical protein